MAIYSEYEKTFGDDLLDPRDALTRLANQLPEKPFFENAVVFIDGYYTFTEQEYSVIKHIISQSKETYISLNYDDEPASYFFNNYSSADFPCYP